jgi:hypothetical protein
MKYLLVFGRYNASHRVSEWLSNFGTALDRADFAAAVNMFEEECYWRDLVSLTWNIIILEGKENIKAMLEATVPGSKPGQWLIEGNATSENGVISSWFTFETAVDLEIPGAIDTNHSVYMTPYGTTICLTCRSQNIGRAFGDQPRQVPPDPRLSTLIRSHPDRRIVCLSAMDSELSPATQATS